MSNQVFISYSRKDKYLLDLVEVKLKDHFDIWTDRRNRSGRNWVMQIDNAIRQSFAMIIILSDNSIKSPYVTYEWSFAIGMGIEVVQIQLADLAQDIHPKLNFLHRYDFSTKDADWEEVIEDLKDKQDVYLGTDKAIERTILLLNEGREQHRTNNLPSALKTFNKAIEIANRDFIDDLLYEIGRIQLQLNRPEEALETFEKAVNIKDENDQSENVKSLIELGHIYRGKASKAKTKAKKEEFLSKSESLFRNALNTQPDILDANGESVWGSLGGILKRRGRTNEAIHAYRQATRYKKSSYPYNNLGLLFIQEGETALMREMFRLVALFARAKLLVDPGDEWVHNDLFISQLATNELQEIDKLLDNALLIGSPDSTLPSLISTMDDLLKVPNLEADIVAYIKKAKPRIQERIEDLKKLQN